MKRLTLREYQLSELHGFSREDAASLAAAVPELNIQIGVEPGSYVARPGSWVGGVSLPGLDVQILPKIGIERLLFLVSYAVDPKAWKPLLQSFRNADSVVEAIAPAFAYLVSRATHRGLLHGYRSHEESLLSVRGRIRFDDQLRTRWGIAPPLEVRFDDHTADIEENRLLKAALYQLTRVRIRSSVVAAQLGHLLGRFEGVSLTSYQRGALPDVPVTRLNRHYEPAINLARLILANTSFDVGHGAASGSSFLLDMNDVFERFLYRALLEELGESPSAFRHEARITLDEADSIVMKPDLSLWRHGRCVWVGDAKYKRTQGVSEHADIYQMLAYTAANRVSRGTLIYATCPLQPIHHSIRGVGKWVTVNGIDVANHPEAILEQVRCLGRSIRLQTAEEVQLQRAQAMA